MYSAHLGFINTDMSQCFNVHRGIDNVRRLDIARGGRPTSKTFTARIPYDSIASNVLSIIIPVCMRTWCGTIYSNICLHIKTCFRLIQVRPFISSAGRRSNTLFSYKTVSKVISMTVNWRILSFAVHINVYILPWRGNGACEKILRCDGGLCRVAHRDSGSYVVKKIHKETKVLTELAGWVFLIRLVVIVTKWIRFPQTNICLL